MTHDDKIGNGKLQRNINKKNSKKLSIIIRKIDKYEYFTDEKILPSDQSRMIEQAKFTYSHLGKSLEKFTKAMEYQGRN